MRFFFRQSILSILGHILSYAWRWGHSGPAIHYPPRLLQYIQAKYRVSLQRGTTTLGAPTSIPLDHGMHHPGARGGPKTPYSVYANRLTSTVSNRKTSPFPLRQRLHPVSLREQPRKHERIFVIKDKCPRLYLSDLIPTGNSLHVLILPAGSL